MRLRLTLRTEHGGERDVEVDASSGTTLSEIAPELRALVGAGHSATISTDGRPLPGSLWLGGPGLRTGSVLTLGPVGARRTPGLSALQLRIVGGPDAGRVIPLARGSHRVGRGRVADIRLLDPDVSREHLEITTGLSGVGIRDLGSTNGTWLDGDEIAAEVQLTRFGQLLRAGNTSLSVVASSEPPAATRPGDGGWVLVNRPPRILDPASGTSVEFPTQPAVSSYARAQWLSALLPTVLGVGLALYLDNLQFLAFALLTPITMLSSGISDRWVCRRSRRQARHRFALAEKSARHEIEDLLANEVECRRREFPDPAAVALTASTPDCRLWERRPDHADFLALRMGLSDHAAATTATRGGRPLEGMLARAVPTSASLRSGAIGVAGPPSVSRGLARWLVGQLVVLHSPRDLTLCLLVNGPSADWHWLRWLETTVSAIAVRPDEHLLLIRELADQITGRLGALRGSDGRWRGAWTVVIIDPARCAAAAPGLRTLLEDGPKVGVSALCVDDDPRLLPPSCRAVARVMAASGARLEVSGGTEPAFGPVIADRVSVSWAERLARDLAPLRDCEAESATVLPDQVRLLDLLQRPDLTAEGLLSSWSSGNRPTTVLGLGEAGIVEIDLIRDGPHILVAGSTGSGKSELLRSLIAGLAVTNPPDRITFVLIDYKGGAAFAECASLPHALGSVTDLDRHLTRRALLCLEAELHRRESAFADAGVSDLDGYWATSETARPSLPRLVLVVDEFAALTDDLPSFVTGLVGIAQRGRSLGVHLVLATQRPAGVVSPEIKANMALRIALRVTDPAESSDVIGTEAAARLPKGLPGRAFARLADGLVQFQTGQIGVTGQASDRPALRVLGEWNRPIAGRGDGCSKTNDLEVLRDAAREAARKRSRPLPAPPWLDPVPAVVIISDLRSGGDVSKGGEVSNGGDVGHRATIEIGLTDDPARQRQYPSTLDLAHGGSVGLIGSMRSGRSTAIRTIVAAAADRYGPAELQVYVIDCAGGSSMALADLPQCGTAVAANDPVSVALLITRIGDEVSRRLRQMTDHCVGSAPEARDAGLVMPMVLVAVDGWEGLAAMSEEYDAGRTADALLRLLREAASAGVTVLLAGDRAVLGVRVASSLRRKFLFELIDRTDFAMAGINQSSVPITFNPGRAVCAEDGLEVQFALLDSNPAAAAQWRAVRRIADARTQMEASAAARPCPEPIRIRPLPSRITRAQLTATTAGMSRIQSTTAGARTWEIRRSTTTTPGSHTKHHGPSGILLGVGGDDAGAVHVDVFAGNARFLIAGVPRGGRSNAALRIAEQLRMSGVELLVIAPQRSPLVTWARAQAVCWFLPTDTADTRTITSARPDLVIVDDSEQVDDTPIGEALLRLMAGLGCAVVAVARSDDLLISFRGVAAEVRRSRTGLLLQPGVADGETLGIRVPPHRGVTMPGRGLLVTDALRKSAPDGLPIQVLAPDDTCPYGFDAEDGAPNERIGPDPTSSADPGISPETFR